MADYTNINSVKIALNIANTDGTQDSLLNQLIPQSTSVINEWCFGNSLNGFNQAIYTEQYKGNNYQELPLNQRPVVLVQTTGTLTANSPTVTVASAANLIVGMPVCGTQPTPVNAPTAPAITPGTTISTISGTTLTLSQNANVSGSQTLFFGVQVWVDDTTPAYWGQSSGSFGTSTAYTPGVDFAVEIDQTDGVSSRCGLLYNINGTWKAPFNYVPGIISPVLGPSLWGNIKVTYCAGYVTVPFKVGYAANLLVARMYDISQRGTATTSEGVKDYSYTLASIAKEGCGMMTPEISSLLAGYRNVAV